jgi:hypothetical protein
MSQYVHAATRYFTPASAITQYQRVIFGSGGTISTAGATDIDVGTAEQSAFTTGLNPLAAIPVRLNTAEGTRKMIANTTCSKGDVLYNAASGRVGTVNNGFIAGIAFDAATAGGDIIEVLRVPDFSATALTDHQIQSIIAASTAITATPETAFSNGVVNFAANTLLAGDVIRICAQGTPSAIGGADTLVIKLKNGTNVLLNTGAVVVAAGDIFFLQGDLVIRDIGGTGHAVFAGMMALGVPATVTAKPKFLASMTVNTQAVNDITVSATWNQNTSGNTCRLDVFNVQHLLA